MRVAVVPSWSVFDVALSSLLQDFGGSDVIAHLMHVVQSSRTISLAVSGESMSGLKKQVQDAPKVLVHEFPDGEPTGEASGLARGGVCGVVSRGASVR